MEIITSPQFTEKLTTYPAKAKEKITQMRAWVREVAGNLHSLKKLEETLKWGEPSFLTRHGSTLRMDWKEKSPSQFALYFQCTSQLVPTFQTLYADTFKFEGTRAIVLKMDEPLPEEEIKHCIELALTYHKVKHLPLLGA